MRQTVLALCVGFGLGAAGVAEAQFANHSIGISAGYLNYGVAGTPTGLSGGFNLGIDYSLFFESGLDVYARSLFGIYSVVGNVTVPVGGGLGVRYLFLQEWFQPYVGVSINFAYFTFQTPDVGNVLFGGSVYAGAQYYFNSSFSLGITVEYQLNFAPVNNFPLFQGIAAFLRAATHF
jgi:outer membrane protein